MAPAHGVDGVDTCGAAVTTLAATTFIGTTISDGYLSGATPAGDPVATSSSVTTTARNAHQLGGYATARQARILRRRHRLEGLELLCAAGLTHGTYGEISRTDAQRDADAVRSIVLDTAVLHAGDVVQSYCSDTSGER